MFEKCRALGISLNAKKSIFIIKEGKLLGHVVSKQVMVIEPKRVFAIRNISFLSNKKVLQSFLGHINLVGKFIHDFTHIIKPISYMLKKDVVFLWTYEARKSFNKIKEAILTTLVLKNP